MKAESHYFGKKALGMRLWLSPLDWEGEKRWEWWITIYGKRDPHANGIVYAKNKVDAKRIAFAKACDLLMEQMDEA